MTFSSFKGRDRYQPYLRSFVPSWSQQLGLSNITRLFNLPLRLFTTSQETDEIMDMRPYGRIYGADKLRSSIYKNVSIDYQVLKASPLPTKFFEQKYKLLSTGTWVTCTDVWSLYNLEQSSKYLRTLVLNLDDLCGTLKASFFHFKHQWQYLVKVQVSLEFSLPEIFYENVQHKLAWLSTLSRLPKAVFIDPADPDLSTMRPDPTASPFDLEPLAKIEYKLSIAAAHLDKLARVHEFNPAGCRQILKELYDEAPPFNMEKWIFNNRV